MVIIINGAACSRQSIVAIGQYPRDGKRPLPNRAKLLKDAGIIIIRAYKHIKFQVKIFHIRAFIMGFKNLPRHGVGPGRFYICAVITGTDKRSISQADKGFFFQLNHVAFLSFINV